MENKLVITKLVVHSVFALFFVAGLSFSNCSSNSARGTLSFSKIDTIEKAADSSAWNAVIYILSSNGELVNEFKYYAGGNHVDFDNYIKGYPTSDTLTGDFNGDGNIEKAWFKNTGYEAYVNCRTTGNRESCKGIIQFSDKSIKPLVIEYCPMYTFKNEGDLNDDGKDEIGVLPGWFAGGCRYYEVYTLKENQWTLVCDPIHNTFSMREAGIVMIERVKDEKLKGYVIIRQSVESYYWLVPHNEIPEQYLLSSCAFSNVVERIIKPK